MRRINASAALMPVIISIILILAAGCAKKETLKTEAPLSEKRLSLEKQPPVPPPPRDEEKALQEAAAKKAQAEALAERLAKEKEQEQARAEAVKEQLAKEKERQQRLAEEAAAAQRAKVEQEAAQFADIHFAFNSHTPKLNAQTILAMHARWLSDHPEYVVQIEGHCDAQGSKKYNLALGLKRALSAQAHLVGSGVDKARISTISYGEDRPLDPGQNKKAWAKNRRVHFTVTKKN